MSQFDMQYDTEIIEIAIFTRMKKANGNDRIASVCVAAWQDLSNGEIHQEQISLRVMGEKVKEINKYIKWHSILRLKVRRNYEGYENSFLFVEKMKGNKFPELKKIKKMIQKQVAGFERKEKVMKAERKATIKNAVYNDEILGKINLSNSLGQLETVLMWMDDNITVSIQNESEAHIKISIDFLKELVKAQKEWDKRIREYAANTLTELANEWNNGQEISRDEFINRITLCNIYIDSEGNFEFWFDDDDIFLGHSVMISGDIHSGPSDADIPG